MHSHILFRLGQGALLASLLLIIACDRVVDPIRETPPEVFFRFEQASMSEHVLSGATEITGTFTASGAIVDSGGYEEVLAIGGSRIYGYRRLEGTRGTVFMQFTGLVSDDGQQGRVQVTIHRGTRAYAGLVGSETFEIALEPGASALKAMNTFTAKLGQE